MGGPARNEPGAPGRKDGRGGWADGAGGAANGSGGFAGGLDRDFTGEFEATAAPARVRSAEPLRAGRVIRIGGSSARGPLPSADLRRQ